MAKNIKWGNKQLPGLSFDELNKLTDAKLAMSIGGTLGGKIGDSRPAGLAAKASGQLHDACVKGGKATGRKNVESGHLEKVRDPKKAGDASRKKVKCIHCGKEAATYNHARWHGDNCKHKK